MVLLVTWFHLSIWLAACLFIYHWNFCFLWVVFFYYFLFNNLGLLWGCSDSKLLQCPCYCFIIFSGAFIFPGTFLSRFILHTSCWTKLLWKYGIWLPAKQFVCLSAFLVWFCWMSSFLTQCFPWTYAFFFCSSCDELHVFSGWHCFAIKWKLD